MLRLTAPPARRHPRKKGFSVAADRFSPSKTAKNKERPFGRSRRGTPAAGGNIQFVSEDTVVIKLVMRSVVAFGLLAENVRKTNAPLVSQLEAKDKAQKECSSRE
jgi:hypothetical protein